MFDCFVIGVALLEKDREMWPCSSNCGPVRGNVSLEIGL